jgi:hypothetical protein
LVPERALPTELIGLKNEQGIEVVFTGVPQLMHRKFIRNKAAEAFDVHILEEELKILKGTWIPKKMWGVYDELINAIQKVANDLQYTAKERIKYSLKCKRLLKALENYRLKYLIPELEKYFTEKHPERVFAEKLFDVERELKEFEANEDGDPEKYTLGTKEASCKKQGKEEACIEVAGCIWDPKKLCLFRPLRKNTNEELANDSIKNNLKVETYDDPDDHARMHATHQTLAALRHQ